MKKRLNGIAAIMLFLVFGSNVTFAQVSPTPQTQMQQTEVTDQELSEFAQAFQMMRMLNQEIQQELSAVVEEEGMQIQRFNEIHQANVDPATPVDATDDEMKQYETITSEIEKRQVGFEKQMEEIVSEQEISFERYQEIALQLQNDPELQQRLRETFEDN